MKSDKICLDKKIGYLAAVVFILIIAIFGAAKLTSVQTSTGSRASVNKLVPPSNQTACQSDDFKDILKKMKFNTSNYSAQATSLRLGQKKTGTILDKYPLSCFSDSDPNCIKFSSEPTANQVILFDFDNPQDSYNFWKNQNFVTDAWSMLSYQMNGAKRTPCGFNGSEAVQEIYKDNDNYCSAILTTFNFPLTQKCKPTCDTSYGTDTNSLFTTKINDVKCDIIKDNRLEQGAGVCCASLPTPTPVK
jgi:hypothetical protein